MRLTIIQPAYLAWPGYYDRIKKSDLLIYLDDVMLDNSSKTRFTNRNRINTSNGPLWLTLPIKTKGNGEKKINELEIVQDNWKKKHTKNIFFNYKNSPYFKEHSSFFFTSYEKSWELLVDLIYHFDNYLFNLLKINTPIFHSSKINACGTKSDYILNLCKSLGASEYVSGIYGREYLNQSDFKKEGIKILIHEYEQIPYKQNFKNFTQNLSVIDLIFNHGSKTIDLMTERSKLVEL